MPQDKHHRANPALHYTELLPLVAPSTLVCTANMCLTSPVIFIPHCYGKQSTRGHPWQSSG